MLPTVIFLVAAVTAFATGTSWGVMGILMPLVIPLCWNILESHGMAGSEQGMAVFYASVSSVMAGAVWGDHCSPISDTTVLSSMASGCDHVEHVRTQMPYAMLAGLVALGVGTIPGGFGFPPLFSILAGLGILFLTLNLIGRQPDSAGQ